MGLSSVSLLSASLHLYNKNVKPKNMNIPMTRISANSSSVTQGSLIFCYSFRNRSILICCWFRRFVSSAFWWRIWTLPIPYSWSDILVARFDFSIKSTNLDSIIVPLAAYAWLIRINIDRKVSLILVFIKLWPFIVWWADHFSLMKSIQIFLLLL